MPEDEIEDDEWEDIDSGPFCRHWGDPLDCEELCVCKHKCCEHQPWDDDSDCRAQDCPCEKFEDADA